MKTALFSQIRMEKMKLHFTQSNGDYDNERKKRERESGEKREMKVEKAGIDPAAATPSHAQRPKCETSDRSVSSFFLHFLSSLSKHSAKRKTSQRRENRKSPKHCLLVSGERTKSSK